MSSDYENRVIKAMSTDNLLAHGYASLTLLTDGQSTAGMLGQVTRYAREVASRGSAGEALQLMTYARVAASWPVTAWGAHPDRSTDYVTPLGNRYPRVIPTPVPRDYDILTGKRDGRARPFRRTSR